MQPLTPASILATTSTDYCGNVIYENGVLSKILTEEGYITLSGATPMYHYFLKDHQGNNRVVINQGGTVEQVNHYYPFGGLLGESMAGGVQPYKYNGKELDRMHGLDLYDYGARHYDAALGKWLTVDPLAEKYYSFSQYVYCANNPVRFIDPQGDTISVYIQGQYYTYGIQNGQAGFIDKSGNMYSGNDSFASSLLSAFGSLRQQNRGRELVDYLAGTSGNVIVRNVINTLESNHATPDGKGIIWDPSNTSGGINMNHSTSRPSFIGLGHEMAHIEDIWKGTIDNSSWGNTGIANSEKYATHVENQIRAEHGILLRGSYGIDMSSGSPRIDRNTQLIDVVRSGNNALYYSKFYKQNISFTNPLNNKRVILPSGLPYKY